MFRCKLQPRLTRSPLLLAAVAMLLGSALDLGAQSEPQPLPGNPPADYSGGQPAANEASPDFSRLHRGMPPPGADPRNVPPAHMPFALGRPPAAATTAPSTLPPTPATAAPITSAPLTATAIVQPSTRPHRAHVTYSGGLLDVRANDSSLNQILRAVGRATGMTITGGVADERVYGNYGPATPGVVLATLLDGTGSNMFLRETASAAPSELILTARTGAITPPSPSSPQYDDTNDAPDDLANDGAGSTARPAPPTPQPLTGNISSPAAASNVPPSNVPATTPSSTAAATPTTNRPAGASTSGPVPIPQPLNNVNGSAANSSPTAASYPTTDSVPIDALPTPSTTPSTRGIVDSPNPPARGSTTSDIRAVETDQRDQTPAPGSDESGAVGSAAPATQNGNTDSTQSPSSPDGTKTPQQIFDMLQKLQEDSQRPAATGSATPDNGTGAATDSGTPSGTSDDGNQITVPTTPAPQ